MAENGKIFKLCRVHNYIDYSNAIDNGVNMIGLHAVSSNLESYIVSEQQYCPINKTIFRNNRNLPISDYEIDGIRDLIKRIDNEVPVALVIEDDLEIRQIKECIQFYNLDNQNLILQLHFRAFGNKILQLKEVFKNRIICTVGLNQLDFESYINELNQILDPDNDFLLIDFSKHQPDYISNSMEICTKPAIEILESRICSLKKNKLPLLIADDTSVDQMRKYLKFLDVNDIDISGIDMQNAVELDKKDIRYEIIEGNNGQLIQVKVRKSREKLQKWKSFLSDDFSSKNNFIKLGEVFF